MNRFESSFCFYCPQHKYYTTGAGLNKLLDCGVEAVSNDLDGIHMLEDGSVQLEDF